MICGKSDDGILKIPYFKLRGVEILTGENFKDNHLETGRIVDVYRHQNSVQFDVPAATAFANDKQGELCWLRVCSQSTTHAMNAAGLDVRLRGLVTLNDLANDPKLDLVGTYDGSRHMSVDRASESSTSNFNQYLQNSGTEDSNLQMSRQR